MNLLRRMMDGVYVLAAAVNGAETAHRAAQMPAEQGYTELRDF